MKTWFLLAIAYIIGSSSVAQADSKLGVGFVLGSPSALSGKWYQTDQRAIDLQLAFFNDDYMLIYGDYVFHFPGAFKADQKFIRELSPYVGVGPLLAFGDKDRRHAGKYFDDRDDDFAIGVRVPFGIEWLWDEVPLGIGVELAPGIIVAPNTDGFVQAGISLRYYF